MNTDILGNSAATERGLNEEVYTGEGGAEIELRLVTGAKGISNLLVLRLIDSDFNRSSQALLEHQH